ncbi:MAG: hypothetical protein U1C66_00785 [Patescibacteria group bacterium]|nr:hypothetical protein [Patescibacteria group bacterium]
MEKKKVTLESLAKTVGSIVKSIDSLAVMTKHGFDELRDSLRAEFRGEIGKLRTEVKAGFTETNEHLSYHQTDLDSLTHRVKRLEKFTGIDK